MISKTTKADGTPIYSAGGGASNYNGLANPTGNDRSNAYAPASGLINWLTALNGNGPSCIRVVQPVGGGTCVANYQNAADLISPNTWSWAAPSLPPTTGPG